MSRRLGQRDVLFGEVRRLPDGCHAECRSASDSHVGYRYIEDVEQHIIRRDVWVSWPVVEEADR